MRKHSSNRTGFTLIEILIVVVILAVLAAMVIPQFGQAAEDTRVNSIKMDLFRIRTQLGIYREQHKGEYPTADDFVSQMILASNDLGDTAPKGTDGYPLGPYLLDIPINANNGLTTVTQDEPGDISGWYYDQATGDFRANDSAESRQW
ncbi:MAG: type II secretion system protein [Phycisphaeraceae bacterium]|nr:type II secretion system protein [Phycisphaeraceae bacterium]